MKILGVDIRVTGHGRGGWRRRVASRFHRLSEQRLLSVNHARPSFSAHVRHFGGRLRHGVKPYRAFLPFPASVHRIALGFAMVSLSKIVRKQNANWDQSIRLVLIGVPKSASTTLAHHFRSNLGDADDGGSFLYVRDPSAIARAVRAGILPTVVHVGHQSPHVLIRAGLISESTLEEIDSIAVWRPEEERIKSACLYLAERRYLPTSWDQQKIFRLLKLVGRPKPAQHHTGITYGPQVHLARASAWLEPDEWAGPRHVLDISNLAQGVRGALERLGMKPVIDPKVALNERKHGKLTKSTPGDPSPPVRLRGTSTEP